MSPQSDRLECRWIIEAMRNGVPNRQAVKRLECNQPRILDRFHKMLSGLESTPRAVTDRTGHSLLVTGDFGMGKSHLLANLEQVALERGFACSSVVVSKETPLYNLGEVFRAAAAWGTFPDSPGMMIEAAWDRLLRNPEALENLIMELESGTYNLHPIFSATLRVRYRCPEEDINTEIGLFWSGGKIRISRVKEGLKLIGHNPDLTAPSARILPPQHLVFLSLLLRSAGCHGWVVLLDELELIASCSRLQRGKAYAELARWAGTKPSVPVPGLVVVGAVTGDFAESVLSKSGSKQDSVKVPSLLREKHPNLEKPAVAGMGLLARGLIPLRRPDMSEAQRMVDRLQEIYSHAYAWNAQDLKVKDLGAPTDLPRVRVRTAIRLWDRRRYDSH